MNHKQARENRQKVIDFIKSGGTIQQASTLFGLSQSYIRNICSDNSIRLSHITNVASINSFHILKQLIDSDETYETIGTKYSISKARVEQIAQRARQAGFVLNPNRKYRIK